ncbi:MAG: ABC transporter ATP-binding protein/permease [Firmicutes bacterium]|nr:ABC transporter ATP-binding protein/permease [Bacillota bacterium]MDY5676421.1 ABC transporter ATP-binding protein [Eubacteriales bacterium]
MHNPPKNNNNKPKHFKKTFGKLLVSLKDSAWQIIIGLICAGISTVLAIIGPDQIKKIGTLILQKPVELNEVTKIAISLLIIYGMSFVFSFIQGILINKVTAKISKNFRSKLSQKINNLPLSYIDTTPTGDVLSRVTNDVDTLGDTLNTSLSYSVTSIATVIGSIIMMFSYSWKLSLVALAIVPISVIVISLIFKSSQKYFKLQQDELGLINGHIEEIYAGHNVITAYNAEDKVEEKFDKINGKLFSSSYKANILSGLMHPIMNFFGNLGYAIIIIWGGIMSIKDITFVPVVIAFVTYYRMFNNEVSQVANIFSTLQTTVASSERIFEFLEAVEQEDESNKKLKLDVKTVKGNIEFKNLNFGYTPEKQILFDLNTKIKAGQKIAIVGSTGAGKTTLVNLLMRFYEPNSGDILIDGTKISDLKRENVRKLFGMVLQDTWLFEGTIKENIAYGNPKASIEDIINACKYAGIHHLIMSQPNGYDCILNEETSLSGGEKQLLTIVRAMLHDAPMLILDEATSSVDTRTEILIQKAMDKLLKNRTSFIIAHRLSTIVNADVILVMKDGRIVESGTHEQLLELNGVYSSLYRAQF